MRGQVRGGWWSLVLALVLANAPPAFDTASAHGALPVEPQVVRLATGGVGGTYRPIGRLIAEALSSHNDSSCVAAADCTVGGVVVVPQTSNGSVANVEAMERGLVELALIQSNIADWAFRGTGRSQGRPPAASLRAVATLYQESLHLVTRTDSGIHTVPDLRDRRVSLDEPGSGTLGDVRELLSAFNLSERDLKPEFVKPDLARARMREGKLDAFFIVAGAPMTVLQSADRDDAISLVPIDGPPVDALLARLPFYSRTVIPDGTYPGVPDTPTIAVGAQLLVRADLGDDLVYRLTRALWSDSTRAILDKGHAKGGQIRRERALDGISIPLHPGAERFYREQGMIR